MAEGTKEAAQKAPVEKPTNCVKCNKRLQRKAWYYRNGGYYCGKRCWKLESEAAAKKAAEAKQEAEARKKES